MPLYIIILMFLFMFGGTVLIVYGFVRFHQFQIIRDTPTSKIRSMAMGLVEIVAIVVGARYIKTPFTQKDCVFYSYFVEEYQIETSTDSDGHVDIDHTWKMIAKGERRIPFYAADETGEAYIEPTGAKIEAKKKGAYYQDKGTGWGKRRLLNSLREYDSGVSTSIDINNRSLRPIDTGQWISSGSRVGDRKYHEFYIEPDEKLYILGTAARNTYTEPDVVAVKKGKNEPIFIISYKSEKELSRSLKLRSVGFLIGGSIFLIIGIVLLFLFSMNLG